MKKIIVDLRMYNSSGIGTYIRNILSYITSSSDCEFTFIGDIKDRKVLTNLGRNCNCIFNLTNKGVYSLSEQLLLNSIKNRNVDLFFSPHYNIPVFINSPLLVTIHDCAHMALSNIFTNNFLKKYYVNFMFDRIKKKASRIITVSNFSKSEIIKYTGIDADKITVIYNGVDKLWFNNKIRNIEGLGKDRPYIIYVGNVKPHKNLLRLLKAYEILKGNIEHNLVIVGEKDKFITKDYKVLELSAKMSDRVFFTGYIPDSKLREYVFNSSLMVFPSLYEGFGLPPLEAMAAGIPVCCSDIPVLKEVCGNCVEYFDPYDIESIAEKIKLIINDKFRAENLINAGINKAKLFSWDKAAKEHQRIINSLI